MKEISDIQCVTFIVFGSSLDQCVGVEISLASPSSFSSSSWQIKLRNYHSESFEVIYLFLNLLLICARSQLFQISLLLKLLFRHVHTHILPLYTWSQCHSANKSQICKIQKGDKEHHKEYWGYTDTAGFH